jgi:hypothetical protein
MRAGVVAVNFACWSKISAPDTISVRFFSQDFFYRSPKIKFRFFLVDVDADF